MEGPIEVALNWDAADVPALVPFGSTSASSVDRGKSLRLLFPSSSRAILKSSG